MNQEEDGNNENTNGTHDEQWDLTSPLLLQLNNSINQEDKQTNPNAVSFPLTTTMKEIII